MNWLNELPAILQAILAALSIFQQQGKSPAQARQALVDHVTPGQPNAPELS